MVMALQPRHRGPQTGTCRFRVSARSGRTRSCAVWNMQPTRRQRSARRLQIGWQTTAARSTCSAQHVPSGPPLRAVPRRSAARHLPSPRTGSSARVLHTAPRAPIGPTAPNTCSGRTSQPAPTDGSAHSVPCLAASRRAIAAPNESSAQTSRAVRWKFSTLPSQPDAWPPAFVLGTARMPLPLPNP